MVKSIRWGQAALLIMGKLERDLFRLLKKVYPVVKRNLELREVRLKEEILCKS